MADPLSSLRAAYAVLENQVIVDLRTQVGDTTRLRLQRDEAFRLLESAEPHRHLFPPAEFATLQWSIGNMADLLDEACHLSTDPQDAPSITVVAESSTALTLRGLSGLSGVFHCNLRTIRRRTLELGIATPGVPVYVEETIPDGSHT
ncbi:hypothetical protein K438DRAFT_1969578 [Mycena galopus ATCC 62051]|nr:hypothetical protein K438DRAFT_1969578 [Mycena galopus ATCC 62051]